jgi:hypothetical protein
VAGEQQQQRGRSDLGVREPVIASRAASSAVVTSLPPPSDARRPMKWSK